MSLLRFLFSPGARGVPQSYVDALLRELAKTPAAPTRCTLAAAPGAAGARAGGGFDRGCQFPCPARRSHWRPTPMLSRRRRCGLPGSRRDPHQLLACRAPTTRSCAGWAAPTPPPGPRRRWHGRGRRTFLKFAATSCWRCRSTQTPSLTARWRCCATAAARISRPIY